MSSIGVNWMYYIALFITLVLIMYSSYRCAIKIGNIQTRLLQERLQRDAEANQMNYENRGTTCPSRSNGTRMYTIAAVVMSSNVNNYETEESQRVEEPPPPYDEAIFYPISKAMENLNKRQE